MENSAKIIWASPQTLARDGIITLLDQRPNRGIFSPRGANPQTYSGRVFQPRNCLSAFHEQTHHPEISRMLQKTGIPDIGTVIRIALQQGILN